MSRGSSEPKAVLGTQADNWAQPGRIDAPHPILVMVIQRPHKLRVLSQKTIQHARLDRPIGDAGLMARQGLHAVVGVGKIRQRWHEEGDGGGGGSLVWAG